MEYTFDYPGTADENNSFFGNSVSISNETVIIGAPYEINSGLSQEGGFAYIYNISTVSSVPAYTPAPTNTVTPTQTAAANPLNYTLDNPYAAPTVLSYGYSVALGDNLLSVGAPAYNSNNGEVYIYDILTGNLLETISNPLAAADEFGMTVDMNAEYLIVRSESNVYAYSTSTWSLLFTFNVGGDNRYVYLQPSRGISVSGSRLIIGDTLFDDASANTGRAYIYDMLGGTPTTPTHTFENPNVDGTPVNDYFGISVAIDGDNVIIGASRESDANGTDEGKAYIYDLTSGTPTTPVYILDNPNSANYGYTFDYFGYSVDIKGNIAAVGAPFGSREDGTQDGNAFIYDVSTGGMLRAIQNPMEDGWKSRFGVSIKISGNDVMVGAETQHTPQGPEVGNAYIFDITTGDLINQYDNPVAGGLGVATFEGYAAYNYFGHGIGISANYAVVGAYNTAYTETYADGTGKVYVYGRIFPTPTPTLTPTPTPTPTLTVNASVTPTLTPTPTPVYEFLSGDIIATVVPADPADIYAVPNSNYYQRYLLIATYSSAEVLAITGGNTTINILGMEFDVDEQPDNQPFPDYGIGMKLTTNDITLDNSGTNGGTFTIVKSPSPESFTTGVVKEFTFDTPLQWTEGNNLVVSWAWGDTTDWSETGKMPSGAGIMYIDGLDDPGTFAADDLADPGNVVFAAWRPVFRLKLGPV